jgi:hypothetical protein
MVAIGAKYNDGTGINVDRVCTYDWYGTNWTQCEVKTLTERLVMINLSGNFVSLSDMMKILLYPSEQFIMNNDGTASNAGHVHVHVYDYDV